MSLLNKLGNGMRKARMILPVLAMGIAAQRDVNAQGYVFPFKGPISPGVVYDEKGESHTAVAGPGFMVTVPNDKPAQEAPQSSGSSSAAQTENRWLRGPFLWEDKNGDGLIQRDELIENGPTQGKLYHFILFSGGIEGIDVRCNVYEEGKRVASDYLGTIGSDGIKKRPVIFGSKPLRVEFMLGSDGYSKKTFTPRE